MIERDKDKVINGILLVIYLHSIKRTVKCMI